MNDSLSLTPAIIVTTATADREILMKGNGSNVQDLAAFVYEDGTVLTRWRMSWRQRIMALFTGNIYLWQMTGGRGFSPCALTVGEPK
jgi:hypothetical protein